MISKSAYLDDFWAIMWHWRLNAAENSALISQINYTLVYIQIEKLFLIVKIVHNITAFTVFLIKLVSISEQKKLFMEDLLK